jgi:hypothetical protein
MTFSMQGNYHARIKKYLTFSGIASVILLIISIVYFRKNDVYDSHYLGVYYTLGLMILIYISYKIIYLLLNRGVYFSLFAGNWHKKDLLMKLYNRHLTFLWAFVICFLPNNIIVLVKLYTQLPPHGIVSSFSVYLICLSCVFTFINKFTETRMLNHYRSLLFFAKKVENINPRTLEKRRTIVLYIKNRLFRKRMTELS